MKRKKFKILSYSPKYKKLFKKKKEEIANVIKRTEIHHIGSTAVSNLGGKGIIDIMIAVPDWKVVRKYIESLKKIGFIHVHPKEKGRIFLSKDTESKSYDTHIHIIKKGGKTYKDFLTFRDYLRKNKNEAKKYFEFKLEIAQNTRNNRNRYRKLKVHYIENVLKKIKKGKKDEK